MTTTTVPSTTVSAQPVDFIGASLALRDIRPEEIPLTIARGSIFEAVDPSAAEANKLYKTAQPEYQVLYAAPGNRLVDSGAGNLNAVLVNQPLRIENRPGGDAFLLNFLGGNPNLPDWWKWADAVEDAIGVVVGAYAVDRDFNVVLKNPITEDLFQAKMLGDLSIPFPYCCFTVRDLRADYLHYPDYMDQPPDKNQYVANFLQSHRLEELIQPGDLVHLSFAVEGSGPTRKYGLQVPGWLMVERLDGVEKLTRLFT